MDGPGPPRGRSASLAALLVASGAAALLHEAAWFRLLVPVLGAGALPSAVVAAGALLGLAAGSALGGRWADRAARPERVLAAAEFAGAAMGALVPPALSVVGSLSGAAALGAAAALLALAALPWGASIPAAVRALAPRHGEVGSAFARLYAWNTAGAVLGVGLGAAFLFEQLGNRGAVALACGLQALAGVGALALARAHAEPARDAEPRAATWRPQGALVLAAGLAGAAGIGAQVAWMRRLTPVLGATYQVFAAVLAVHLVGIALGAGLLGPRRGSRPLRAILALAALACLLTAATPALLGVVVGAVAGVWWESYGDPVAMLALRAAVAAVLVLPGVLLGAALLPWLVRMSDPGARAAGRGSGVLTAGNLLGGAAGGLVVALWIVPAAGTFGALLLCAAALLAAGALAAGPRLRLAGLAAAAALAAVSLLRPPADRVGHETVGALYSEFGHRPWDTRTLLARDGRTAAVLVREFEGRLEFWIEGSYEASNAPTDRLHLGLLGHVPLVLFEARSERAPHVALVGLGGGYTAVAAALHRPASLTVYELEPEVARAAELFRRVGGGLPPEARLVVADGRKAVLSGQGPLDVLSSDPVHPALGGSSFLYSFDYWSAATARLSPDGLLVQWLPLYHLHEDDLRLVLRTFAAAVPHPYVFLAGRDAILVGSRTPLRLPLERLERALAADAAAPLAEDGLGTPGRLLGLLALDPEGVRAVAGEGDLNTDDRLLLELRSGWREAGDPGAALELLTSRRADPRDLLTGPADAAFERDLEATSRLRGALDAWTRWEVCDAADAFAEILLDEPGNGLARRMWHESAMSCAFERLDTGDLEGAVELARALAAHQDADPVLRLDAAEILIRAGEVEDGRALARPYAEGPAWPRAVRLAEGSW